MKLRERLTKVAEAAIKEGVESSKDIINDNIVPSFEDMGMANVTPGEFAQEEITDKENLVNKGDMSNDTSFNKEEHPLEKALNTAEDILSDLVNISAPEEDTTLEIVKTTDDEHPADCHCPECHHAHHKHMEEAMPLFVQNPEAAQLYKTWYSQLSNPEATLPDNLDPNTVEAIPGEGNTPETMTISDYVCGDINDKADKFMDKPAVWGSLIDQLVADAKAGELVNLKADDAEWLSRLEPSDLTPETSKVAQAFRGVYGESAMAKIIDKALGGKTCEQYLKEAVQLKESDFAGPKDFTPDVRVNFSAVLNAIKDEVGEGSEGVHVDADIDERHNNCYKVSQIDLKKLPKTLKVDTTELKLDGDTYKVVGPNDEYPANK